MLTQAHTILAVDDEPINLRMLERLLRKHFRVLTAGSAEEALQILERENVSLILTDQRNVFVLEHLERLVAAAGRQDTVVLSQ